MAQHVCTSACEHPEEMAAAQACPSCATLTTQRDVLLGTIRQMADQQSDLVRQLMTLTAQREALVAALEQIKEIVDDGFQNGFDVYILKSLRKVVDPALTAVQQGKEKG